MNKAFHLANPNLDFVIKSYLILELLPITLSALVIFILGFIGRTTWSSDGGILTFMTLGFVVGVFVYFFSFLVASLFILVSNRKLMSGSKLSKKSRLGLFGLAFLLYLFTMWILSLFM